MKVTSLRLPEKLQKAAEDTANGAEENLPERIREYLEWYSWQPGARAPRRPPREARTRGEELRRVAEARRHLPDDTPEQQR